MVSLAASATLVAILGASWQFAVGPWAHDVIGLTRKVQTLHNDNCHIYTQLKGCEDFWLHEPSGLLYAVCSDADRRRFWTPALLHLDNKQRPKDDALYILDTKRSSPSNAVITKVKTPGFSGVNGDGSINLHGIGVYVVPSNDDSDAPPTLRLFLNNHRPTLGDNGVELNNAKTGANSTFELFETTLGSDEMKHIRTYAHPVIRTPNRPAPVGPDSFVFTNDHYFKSFAARDAFDVLLPISDVGFCDPTGCNVALSGLKFPNGIVRTAIPDHYLIPSTADGAQVLARFDPATRKLTRVSTVPVGVPTDNNCLSANGDVYTASIADMLGSLAVLGSGADDPRAGYSVVSRIPAEDIAAKGANGWHVERVFADTGKAVNVATSATFDTESRTLYLTGLKTNGIAACKIP